MSRSVAGARGGAGRVLGRVVQDAALGAHEAHVGAAHPASLGSRQFHARLAEQCAADDAAGAGELHWRHYLAEHERPSTTAVSGSA